MLKNSIIKENKSILPIIDYSEKEFLNKKIFDALLHHGGFILNQLDSNFSASTTNLFRSYDMFLKQPNEVKNSFAGPISNLTNLQGFYPYGNFITGSKTCHRYIIIRNGAGNITSPLPFSMKEAADEIHRFTDDIIRCTAQALDIGFCLKNKFVDAFNDYGTITVADHYLPITQEKLQEWVLKGKLTKTDDRRIEAFSPHEDLVPITILTYHRNQCLGLELKQNNKFNPLCLNIDKPFQLQAVVIAGQVMEILTDGLIRAITHQIVINPIKPGTFFQRKANNTFVLLNTKKYPTLKSIINANPKQVATATLISQYEDSFAKIQQTKAIDKLEPDELVPYPTEEEINQYETPDDGIIYERRI